MLHRMLGNERVALVLGSALLFACGGATVTDLQGNPPAGQDAGVDTSVVKDSSVVDEGIGVDVTPPPPPPIEAGPPDVGPPPPDPAPIVCGQNLATASLKCDANKEVCCRTGTGVQMTVACTPGNGCTNASVPLACSTTATCTALGLVGNVCCGNVANSLVTSAKCVPAGNCPGTGTTIRLCDKNGPNVCPVNPTCKTSSYTLAGYDICF